MIAFVLLSLWMFKDGEHGQLPYREAGLTQREAAVHLLSRLTHGPRPGDVEALLAMGMEAWLEAQLAGNLADEELERELQVFPALTMDNRSLFNTYPPPGAVLMKAVKEEAISKQAAEDPKAHRAEIRAFARENGIKSQGELDRQLIGQKILRAAIAENQLREVLTGFWFNHFTVSIRKNQVRPFALAYERDAIRPHALGNFRELLGATAKHPAMLLYLDNAASVANPGSTTAMEANLRNMAGEGGFRGRMAQRQLKKQAKRNQKRDARNRPSGLNENYARELLELHTLGVDGGYSQTDVTEAARVLTGWTVYPADPARRAKVRQRLERAKAVGFVRQEDFLFRADAHDAGSKRILGNHFPPGQGLEEGERLLDLLANHPATARFIATKLARHFVMDQPPASLVDRMAKAFTTSGGEIPAVIRAMVQAPEFWSPEARANKVKTPFEYAVSTVRAVDGELIAYRGLTGWIKKMGQPLYRAPAPNGFSDQGAHWITSGTLVYRLRFAELLADNKIHGLKVDWQALEKKLAGSPSAETWWQFLKPNGGDLPEAVAETLAQLPQKPQVVAATVIASAEFQKK